MVRIDLICCIHWQQTSEYIDICDLAILPGTQSRDDQKTKIPPKSTVVLRVYGQCSAKHRGKKSGHTIRYNYSIYKYYLAFDEGCRWNNRTGEIFGETIRYSSLCMMLSFENDKGWPFWSLLLLLLVQKSEVTLWVRDRFDQFHQYSTKEQGEIKNITRRIEERKKTLRFFPCQMPFIFPSSKLSCVCVCVARSSSSIKDRREKKSWVKSSLFFLPHTRAFFFIHLWRQLNTLIQITQNWPKKSFFPLISPDAYTIFQLFDFAFRAHS